jgi:hypothetical protein
MNDRKPPSLRERLEEIGVGVVVGVLGGVGVVIVLVVIGLNVGSGGGSRSEVESGTVTSANQKPPPALEAADEAVPDVDGPVHERVWAQEGARSFKNPYDLTGEGLRVPYNEAVEVACKIYWPELRSVKQDGYWYRLLTPPWKGRYSPANSYWNGQKPGEPASHPVDWKVKTCKPSS